MLRIALLLALLLLAGACPDRAETVESVGGAPGRQVEEARVRVDRAEVKLQQNAADAAAAAAGDAR